VVFIIDGKRYFLEEYTEIQTNVPLNNNLFNSENWIIADRNYFRKKSMSLISHEGLKSCFV